MKKKLREDLLNKRITGLCDGGIHYLHKPENKNFDENYIEYQIINHVGGMYVADKRNVDEYLIQIDIFSKGSTTELANVVEEVFEELGYLFVADFDTYENETKLYSHKKKYRYYKNK